MNTKSNNTNPDTQTVALRRRDVSQIMIHVMLALIPGTVVYAWLIEPLILFNIFIAIISALCMEAILLHLRGRKIVITLRDGSIIVAAWLLVLCLPPSLPVWQLMIGVFVMTTLGKHLFGGLGNNPFNPAMVAFAVLIVSYPVTMTNWPSSINQPGWDARSGATPLDSLRQERLALARENDQGRFTQQHIASTENVQVVDYSQYANKLILGSPWVWVNLAWLAGGLYLLLARIISWHIPFAMLGTLTLLYSVYAMSGSATAMPVLPALLSGAILLGAFFIATDPVSAAASHKGKLVYGAGIGLFSFVIREFSSYPEGLAFAILLMNTCVPLLDYLFIGSAGISGSAKR